VPGCDEAILVRLLKKSDARAIGDLTISVRQEIGCDAFYALEEFENLFETPWLKNGVGLVLEKETKLIGYGWVSFSSWCKQDVIHLGLFLSPQAREECYYQLLIDALLNEGCNLAKKYNTNKLFFFSRAVDNIHPPILKKFGFSLHPVSMLGMYHSFVNLPRVPSPDKVTVRTSNFPDDQKILRTMSEFVYDDPPNQGEPLHESLLELETKNPTFKPEQVIIAEVANKPIGYLVMFLCKNIPNRAYEIIDFGVLPEWRRKGIGRWLLVLGLNWIKNQGASRAIASTLSSNPALGIFWQTGFRPDPARTYNFFIKTI